MNLQDFALSSFVSLDVCFLSPLEKMGHPCLCPCLVRLVTSFLQTLFCHRLTRFTLSQLLGLLVMLSRTLVLSSSYKGLVFSKHLLSSLTELDGLCLEQGWMDYMRTWLYPYFNRTCSIWTPTSFLKRDEMELALLSSWRGLLVSFSL